jgi:hypothetical protein
MTILTRKLGDRFKDGTHTLLVVPRPSYDPLIDTGTMLFNNTQVPVTEDNFNACTKCFYFKKSYCKTLPIRGECSDKNRADEIKAIFIKIN